MRQPIKTVLCSQAELDQTKQQLAEDGYMILQLKRVEEAVGEKKVLKWTIKAKLAAPPFKAGRELIEG